MMASSLRPDVNTDATSRPVHARHSSPLLQTEWQADAGLAESWGTAMQDESGGERLQPDGRRPDKPVEHIEMALRHVQQTVRVMSDLRAWAVATDKDGTDPVGEPCVWTCERDFEAVVEELRRVQLEAEIYKRRLATTEGRLELVLSAIGRMVTTLPRGSATTFAETR